MSEIPSRDELQAAHCWEADDQVPGRPEMTDFRRQTRYQQSKWREANGHPIGIQPHRPARKARSRPVGSRLPLDYALETGANFLTPAALAAARARSAITEPEQSVDRQRTWADLLSSEALAFNLFGDFAADLRLADRAVDAWWPDAPGHVRAIRFQHSPGWLDPAYLKSLRAFDAAILLDVSEGKQGIIGVDIKYHERAKTEQPKPENMRRYQEVADRSAVFKAGTVDKLKGRSDLAVMWLEHLLLLSMLQHESGTWSWGRYVVIHPAGNSDVADMVGRYREFLADDSTFASATLEELLEAEALSPKRATALRRRYLSHR